MFVEQPLASPGSAKYLCCSISFYIEILSWKVYWVNIMIYIAYSEGVRRSLIRVGLAVR